MKLQILKLLIVLVFQCIHCEKSFRCKENGTYVLDGVYPCECVPALDYTLNCDLTKCSENSGVKVNCRIGSSWKMGCTECWCHDIGSICTSEGCFK